MSLTHAEAVERAALITVTSYDVLMDLTRDATAASFGCRTRVLFGCRRPGAQTFIELADALEVSATLNGRTLPSSAYDGRRIALADLTAENELVVDAVLPTVTDGDGMHRFTDPADGATYLSAYCGVDVAQKVFACFDQPDLKAPIALQVTADPAWTVLANGRPTGCDGASRTFARTAPIPSSLFVVCAGPWHSVTFEHQGLPFGWHARASLAAELDRDADELRAITTACFDHYTRIFDEPFPFDSHDQVMVPGLNWGAMETPGCVTYRDEMLFRGAATRTEQQLRSMVIAHETAHMWFGNLVTMRWWEDTWLSESFADYMGYEVAGSAAGFTDTWTVCAVERKPTAFRADERRSTHPVAASTESVVDVDTAFGNFDMISYAKGNAVLRQLVTWLGEDAFTAGANAYLTRHRFGNADLADFLAALGSATDRDVATWAGLWLQTTGFDTIRVRRDGDVPVLEREGSRPHRFEVSAFRPRGGSLVAAGSRFVDLAQEPLRLEEYAGLVVVPNSGDHTYARLRLDEESWSAVVSALSTIADPLTRAVLWELSLDRVRCAEIGAQEHLALLARHLPAETNPVVFEGVLASARGLLLPELLGPEEVPGALALLADACEPATRSEEPSVRLAATRMLASTTIDADRLGGWLRAGRSEAGVDLGQDLRWTVVRRLVELGEDVSVVDRELATDRSAAGELAAVRARAAAPNAAAKAAAWTRMYAGDADLSNREFTALSHGFWSLGQTELLTPYLDRYLAEAPAIATRGQSFAQGIGWAFPSVPLELSRLADFRAALAARLDDGADIATALHRKWSDRLDDLDVALRVRRAEDARS